MNLRSCTVLCLAASCLPGQVQLRPRNPKPPQEAIDNYFRTEMGKKARRTYQFDIRYDPEKRAVRYEWIAGGKWDRRIQVLSNRVKCTLQCTVQHSVRPLLFTYRMTVSLDSPQWLSSVNISSFTTDKTKFMPKLTDREWMRLPMSERVLAAEVGPDQTGWQSLGYPGVVRMAHTSDRQRADRASRKAYVRDVQYVSSCLPAIVKCNASGDVEFMKSGEDDPDFFVQWYEYSWREPKFDYMRVFGLTLGPGLDMAKAKPGEVLSQLIQDVETARKEGWFKKDEDAKVLLDGLFHVNNALKGNVRALAKPCIEQVLRQLEEMKDRAKVEVFSLVDCNLRFVLGQS